MARTVPIITLVRRFEKNPHLVYTWFADITFITVGSFNMTTDMLNLDRVNQVAAPCAPSRRGTLRLGATGYFIRFNLAWLS